MCKKFCSVTYNIYIRHRKYILRKKSDDLFVSIYEQESIQSVLKYEQSLLLLCDAKYTGVAPSKAAWLTSTNFARTSSFTHDKCPLCAAMLKGIAPRTVGILGFAPCRNSVRKTMWCPLLAATNNANKRKRGEVETMD